MMPKMYQAIEEAIAKGIPPQYVASTLIQSGWPPALVNEGLSAWLSAHGRLHKKTGFRDWLKRYKHKALTATIVLVTISVISSSILLLRPWPTKIMVDSVFGNIPAPGMLNEYTGQPSLILITSLLTIAIFLIGTLFGTLKDYLTLKLGFWLNRSIKEESFRHILHLPLYHQERLAKGDYIYRQNVLTDSLSDLVLDTTASIVQSVIMVVGILIIMFSFNAKLTFISVVLVPFLYILIRVFGPVLGKIGRLLTQNNSDMSSAINESVDNAETVQSFTLEEKQIQRADRLWRQNYELSRKGLLWSRLYRSTNSLLIILATSAVMYFGGTAALNGEMTLGQLLIFMTYMGYLLGPIESLAAEITTRNQKLIDVSRIYEVLTDHEGIESLRRDNHLPPLKGEIVFQNVSYNYKDSPVLKNLSLVVKPGEKVGIIGPSGGGKSTLLKLIPLFIEPTQGRIMIDNVDIQTVSLKELRQRIGWISQSPQLFNGTIIENLTDGDVNRQMSWAEIGKAMQVANVTEFTNRLPMGINSLAGEGGNSLSGGQKQRVAIARGLLKNAPIVCMDEPTAALDNKTENEIRDSISTLISGKTVLMVTHRKALLNLMDTIYVMENGVIRNVKEMGGLDKYLQKITGLEPEVPAAEVVQSNALNRQRIAQLEAEKLQLQQELNTSPPKSTSVDETPDGTIYINH